MIVPLLLMHRRSYTVRSNNRLGYTTYPRTDLDSSKSSSPSSSDLGMGDESHAGDDANITVLDRGTYDNKSGVITAHSDVLLALFLYTANSSTSMVLLNCNTISVVAEQQLDYRAVPSTSMILKFLSVNLIGTSFKTIFLANS